VPGAEFYDVVLWRDGTRVLDAWPAANHLTIAASRRIGSRILAPGRYQWFSFAAFRQTSGIRFGDLAEKGELILSPS
jgi:hypothetical protein